MNKPEGINLAAIGMWVTFLILGFELFTHHWNADFANISGLGYLYIILWVAIVFPNPYRFITGFGASRFFYLVFACLLFLRVYKYSDEFSIRDAFLLGILLPLNLYIIYQIFRLETSQWLHEQSASREANKAPALLTKE